MKNLKSCSPLERLNSASENQTMLMNSLFELNSTEEHNDNDDSNLTNSYQFFFFDEYVKMITGKIKRQENFIER